MSLISNQEQGKIFAFTLIELIMVVAVIITIALIAIPNFSKSKIKAISKEGLANVKLIAAAEIIMKMENNGNYVDCSGSGCNAALKLMLNDTNWVYTVFSGNITASATGVGCTYILNSGDFLTTTTGYTSKSAWDGTQGCL